MAVQDSSARLGARTTGQEPQDKNGSTIQGTIMVGQKVKESQSMMGGKNCWEEWWCKNGSLIMEGQDDRARRWGKTIAQDYGAR